MSGNHEGCQLTMEEIAAVLSLAGRQTLVGFRTEDTRALTAEDLWSACCALVRDGMLTQSDGRFRMEKELAAVLGPVLRAKTALVLTPGSDLYAQVIYYGAEAITAMERASHGRYILSAMDPAELVVDIRERLELEYPDEPPAGEPAPEIPAQLDEPWDTLLRDTRFVLERLDLETGVRTGWLRVLELGIFSYLQWTQESELHCAPLNEETLAKLLRMQLEGEA